MDGINFIPDQPYNPLDKRNLGLSIENALLLRPPQPLRPTSSQFVGAGIYAIYYTGDFPAYQWIAQKNSQNKFEQPIYVGKAVPKGARIGASMELAAGPVLFNRMSEHAASIEQVENLRLDDFCCRYLIVDDIFIPLGETLLISTFNPIWNYPLGGFGNHDPGAGRYNQKCSLWDVVHPGRSWVKKLKPNGRTPEEVLAHLAEFLHKRSGITYPVETPPALKAGKSKGKK